jgi:hypothetical protein
MVTMHVQYVSCETQRDIQNHSRKYERGTRGRRHARRQGSTEVVRRSRGSVSITRRSPCFLIRSAHNADWLPCPLGGFPRRSLTRKRLLPRHDTNRLRQNLHPWHGALEYMTKLLRVPRHLLSRFSFSTLSPSAQSHHCPSPLE